MGHENPGRVLCSCALPRSLPPSTFYVLPAAFHPLPFLKRSPALSHPRTHSSGADVLRGVAILLVLVYHAVGAGTSHGYYVPWSGNTRDFSVMPLRQLLWYYPASLGWAGVALFFVLSGFCIHFSILRAGRFDAGRFFWRRFWRIYPAYLAALLVFLAVDRTPILTGPGAFQLVTHAVFLHNVSHGTFFGINGVFWSIAVEMQLYLLYPVLLWGRARFGLARCLAGTFVLGMAWRAVAVGVWGVPDHVITPVLTLPPLTWFDWTLGAFVAERFHAGRAAFARRWLWFPALAGLFLASTFYRPLTVCSFSLAAAASAVLLDGALQVAWGRGAWVTALEFVGLISYSLYLWHQPLIVPAVSFLTPFLGSPAAWTVFGALLAAGCWVSYRFLEMPGIRLGDALSKRLGLWQAPAVQHEVPAGR